jgi:hypothetical protein
VGQDAKIAEASLRIASASAPCGEVFDMHGPEEVFLHVPHITAAEAVRTAPQRANAN